MQTKKSLRLGYVTSCLLVIFAVSGCGQKGPLYRDAPVAIDAVEAESERAETADDRDNEPMAR
ncbi:LPS translocon maturation chaperone LptM [Marinobacter litoralis]|uniref:LPS translocon maturation chaperone LptM n=1 Tax=Marinobacter litoralis TaxID=187981 RepID=UPI0018EA7CD1|nr:lipoprotein [Marinobacter litoralis]MBJ6135983.1 lipoprotein [Marinobacter litoralis]